MKVEPGYRLGEETAYTDKDGKTYIAYMAVGGLQKNDGTNNEDYSFTNTVISNRVVTLVKKDSKIKDYSNLGGSPIAAQRPPPFTRRHRRPLPLCTKIRQTLWSSTSLTCAPWTLS